MPADAEWLVEGAPSTALLAGDRALVSDGATLSLRDPRLAAPLPLDIGGSQVRGGVWLDGDLLAATEHGLFLWDGLVWPSPLQQTLGEPVQRLVPDDAGAWWLLSDEGWRRRADSAITRITVDGVPARGPIALDGRIGDRAVTWLTARDGPDDPFVVAIDAQGALVESGVYEDVRALATDAGGSAWVADGRRLHLRTADGVWTAYAFESAVAEVLGSAASDRVWVRTVDQVYSGTAAGVAVTQVPPGRWLQVDRQGRLLIADELGVRRASLDLPVALLDIPDGAIDSPTTLTVAPSLADQVVAVSMTLDGEPLPGVAPEAAPWSWVVDPAQHAVGDHTVAVQVTWADGRTRELERELLLGAGIITWDEHLVVLFEDRCSQCHGGTSETVLDTPEAWIAKLPRILELVETQQMPLGLTPLGASEVALIRAWRDGGFQ